MDKIYVFEASPNQSSPWQRFSKNYRSRIIDNEFHQSKSVVYQTMRILDVEGMVPYEFRSGNKNSLTAKRDTESLLKELEKHRLLFRCRPVTACFISQTELNEVKYKKKLWKLLFKRPACNF